MALVLRAGTNSSPSLVLPRTQMRILDPDLGHRPPPRTYLNPPQPQIPSRNQELAFLPPAGRHRPAIVIASLQRVATAVVVSLEWSGICSIPLPVGTRTPVRRLLVPALDPAPSLEVGTPTLAPNPETRRLIQGTKLLSPTAGCTQTPDHRAPYRRPTIS